MMNDLFDLAIKHQQEHDCSAKPYLNGDELIEAIKKYQPKEILEIGTGVGYTAAIMAIAAPEAHIESLEKDSEHAAAAQIFLHTAGVGDRVTIIQNSAEDFFETATQDQYDFIFFDGFQIHYEFLPHYERLLKSSGILFCANNHLQSRTSAQFFEALHNNGNWHILDQFADTTVAQTIK